MKTNTLSNAQQIILGFSCFIYLLACGIALFTATPALDTLYYWEWGRHLALSYFDGPPFIAYIYYVWTHCFGNSVLSINALSLTTNFIIVIPIYLLTKTMFNRDAARITSLIWLVTLFTFQKYAIGFSYDTPLTFFWALSCYWFYKGYQTHADRYFYLAGVSSGLMLLSKYTGIVFFLSVLLLMICVKPYRQLFKKPAIYISVIIAIFVFSPVLVWNYHHQGTSFIFQLHHGVAYPFNWLNIFSYFSALLGNYNFFFLILMVASIRYWHTIKSNPALIYLFVLCWTTILFFACFAPFNVKYNWMESFYVTGVILVGYFSYYKASNKWYITIFIALSSILICGIATANALFKHKRVLHSHYAYAQLGKQLNGFHFKNYPIFVDNYQDGAMIAFYVKSHPKPVSFTMNAHEYGYWGADDVANIKKAKIRQYYLVGDHILSHPENSHCHLVFKNTLPQQKQPNQRNVYLCHVNKLN